MNFHGTLRVVQLKRVLVTVVCLDKNQQSVTATARMRRKADAAPPPLAIWRKWFAFLTNVVSATDTSKPI